MKYLLPLLALTSFTALAEDRYFCGNLMYTVTDTQIKTRAGTTEYVYEIYRKNNNAMFAYHKGSRTYMQVKLNDSGDIETMTDVTLNSRPDEQLVYVFDPKTCRKF